MELTETDSSRRSVEMTLEVHSKAGVLALLVGTLNLATLKTQASLVILRMRLNGT